MTELGAEPAVRLFGICALVLVLKMVLLASYTSLIRMRKGIYATAEDYRLVGAEPVSGPDEEIERARRAHRNDLENVLPFFAVGFFFALSDPSLLAARIGFIGFTLARVLHSVFYVRGMQPHRTLAYTVGLLLMLWMLIAALLRLL
ncbi:MAG: MAPEG family protein [Myxococcota bacterium]